MVLYKLYIVLINLMNISRMPYPIIWKVRLNEMMDKITEIINRWDPAKLMSHAPDDEYNSEVSRIIEVLKFENDSVNLANAIKDIFNESFGEDLVNDFEIYKEIANEILKKHG